LILARVNTELKEFKGRMEQDDWIGQARELHFRKYGSQAAGCARRAFPSALPTSRRLGIAVSAQISGVV
jgi:hypothetical protein